jgi:hypothetical protein
MSFKNDRQMGLFRFVLALLMTAVPLTTVSAAELVDVIDAHDPDDPFDFRADVSFRRTLRRAKITREFNCGQREFAGIADGVDPCPFSRPEGELLNVKELRFQRVTQEVVPRLRFGLWHDLELLVETPVVLSDEQEVRFAGDGGNKNGVIITPENSTIAPANGANLFDVPPGNLPTRSGFGDLLVMLRFSPISQERDAQRATWTLEAGYRAPTGEAMKPGNAGVGRGVHEVVLATGLAKAYNYAEPYTRFELILPFPSGDSLFKDYGDSQEFVGPGKRLNFEFGSEFAPYYNPETGAKFFIDFGFAAGYQWEGRDYTEIFDALGGAGNACPSGFAAEDNRGLPNQACFNPDSRSAAARTAHDGITTVEHFMRVKAHLGTGVYVSEHAKLAAGLSLAHETEHFLTNASVGRDLDGSDLVEAQGQQRWNGAEHNPTFVPAIDRPGRRIRVEETTVFTVGVSLSLML